MRDEKYIKIFKDRRQLFNMLSLDEKGVMLDAIFSYYCDDAEPIFNDPKLAMLFQVLQIDDQRYADACQRNADKMRNFRDKTGNNNNELHSVTSGYKKLQEVTKGYNELQKVTSGYNELQEVTKGYNEDVTKCTPVTYTCTCTNTSTNTYNDRCASPEVTSIEEDVIADQKIENQPSSSEKKKNKKTRVPCKKPSEEEVANYMRGYIEKKNYKVFDIEKYIQDQVEEFFLHYNQNGWMTGRVPMVDWQSSAASWIRRDQQGLFNGSFSSAKSQKNINVNADGSATDMTPGVYTENNTSALKMINIGDTENEVEIKVPVKNESEAPAEVEEVDEQSDEPGEVWEVWK